MDPKKANELVLGFDAKYMYGFVGLFSENYPEDISMSGVTSRPIDYYWYEECCKRSYFLPRGEVETDSSFKQIIPYIAVCNNGRVFTYQRKGSEDRLVGNYSIGIGGHVNIIDLNSRDLVATVTAGAKREFFEELNFESFTYSDNLTVGLSFSKNPSLLYDSSNDVGKVHFGAVYIINISDTMAAGMIMTSEGVSEEWMTLDELKDPTVWDNLESWSQLVVGSDVFKK